MGAAACSADRDQPRAPGPKTSREWGLLCPGPLGWGQAARAGRGPLQLLSRLCGDCLQASPAKKPRAEAGGPARRPRRR